jgi:hypothetical protein
MPRSASEAVDNNFVKGLLTEFSGLNFPENACSDALNVTFEDDGRVTRRKGIDFEDSFTLIPYNSGVTDRCNSVFWQNIAGDSDRAFVVSQIGSELEFFEVIGSQALSDNYRSSYTIDMNTLRESGAPSCALDMAQFAVGNGRLYVAHPYCQPFYVYYDEDADDMLTEQLEIKIRDFTIVDDGVPEANDEITNKTPQAEYNLKNQGWRDRYLEAWEGDTSSNDWPAKSMLWWYFRLPAGEEPRSDASLKGLDFKKGKREIFSTAGNSFAPRGYFILDAFYQDRSAAIGKTVVDVVTSGYQRPCAVAFMNGRLFYGGTNADKYTNTIYFSNIIRDLDQPIRFYQNGDPTSEVSYELLPNDGGSIVIPEAGRILFMKQVADQLFVLATNGVWAVRGSEGIGFTATDYSVTKISDHGALTYAPVVMAEGVPFWWNNEGIWTFTQDKGAVNLTKDTIQTFYDEIPLLSKLSAKGTYNGLTQELMWVYSSTDGDPRSFNRALVFNTSTGAFYPYSFTGGVTIKDVVAISGLGTSSSAELVYDEMGSQVTQDGTGDPITVSRQTTVSAESTFKFLVYDENEITWAELNDEDYIDWTRAAIGSNYESYFVTGFKLKGNAARKQSTPYITVHSEYIEDASCKMIGIWDFASSGNSGRYTNSQQVYPVSTSASSGSTPSYYTFVRRRLKVRGSGLALQLRFESEDNKPFTIIGWATFDMVNERV